VNNATTATNAVLRDIHWEKNDAILVLSTVYGAVERTLQYLYETHPSNPTTVMVEINYPMKHDEVVKAVEEVVSKTKKEGKVKLRLGIVDAITSAPGVIVPWERLVKVLRDQGIMSFVSSRGSSKDFQRTSHSCLRTHSLTFSASPSTLDRWSSCDWSDTCGFRLCSTGFLRL